MKKKQDAQFSPDSDPEYSTKRATRACSAWFSILIAFAAISLSAFEVVGNLDDLELPESEIPLWVADMEILSSGRMALLTPDGVIEVNEDFVQVDSYRFRDGPLVGEEFVRIDGELYILGMISKNSLFGYRNDIQLLRYGEERPHKVWRCSSCDAPSIGYFFNYQNPTMVYAVTALGRQELRIVQLGTYEEWSIPATDYHLMVEIIGSEDQSLGLQDFLVIMWRNRRMQPTFDPATILRLSNVDLSQPRTHIKHYEEFEFEDFALSESSTHQSEPIPIWDTVVVDAGRSKAHLGVHNQLSHEPGEYPGIDPTEKSHLWWEIDTQESHVFVERVVRPDELNCTSATGQLVESYLAVVVEPISCVGNQCGTKVYELRPGGLWREVYRMEIPSHSQVLNGIDYVLFAFSDRVVRLEKGVDYCRATASDFHQSSNWQES